MASAGSFFATKTGLHGSRVRQARGFPASAVPRGEAVRATFPASSAPASARDFREGVAWRSDVEAFVGGAAGRENLRERRPGAEDIGFHLGERNAQLFGDLIVRHVFEMI